MVSPNIFFSLHFCHHMEFVFFSTVAFWIAYLGSERHVTLSIWPQLINRLCWLTPLDEKKNVTELSFMMDAEFTRCFTNELSCNIGTAWFWTDSSWITALLPIVKVPVLELIDYLHTIIDLNWLEVNNDNFILELLYSCFIIAQLFSFSD